MKALPSGNGARPRGPAKHSRTVNKAGGAAGARFSTIAAKYPGRCRRCGGAIAAGEPIRWAPGRGTWHLSDRCGLSLEEESEARAGQAVPTDAELAVQHARRYGEAVEVGGALVASEVF